jgi:hypothetical protein
MGGDSSGERTVYRRAHRDASRHAECRRLHESSCASASALLPVDSDHRGRLQLAVVRAGGGGRQPGLRDAAVRDGRRAAERPQSEEKGG